MIFPMDPIIRRYEPEDSLEEMTGLLHRAYGRLLDMGFRYWASHQSVEDTEERIRKGECWVAVHGERIVATITLRPPEASRGCPWFEREDVATFHQFAVEPALMGQGIGSRLLSIVEERARRWGAAEIACDTAEGAEHLVRMYERRGYRFVEHVDWRGTNYVSVVLSKKVRPSPPAER